MEGGGMVRAGLHRHYRRCGGPAGIIQGADLWLVDGKTGRGRRNDRGGRDYDADQLRHILLGVLPADEVDF